ncbi:MAG: PDZ domain-containing protein [Cytophagales bacterium]|nr:PDZ domain-containing protein [Cytophagales bacterium]
MKYVISYQNPHQHLVDIELVIEHILQPQVIVALPAWRPGRYELGDFIQNVQKLRATTLSNESLPVKKIKKDHWEIDTMGAASIKVKYNYYAYKMDAGSCWLDEDQLYLNFINCLIFAPDRVDETCTVSLEIPENYLIACGLEKIKERQLIANSFYHLVDSPLIASSQLQHFYYNLDETSYHLWIMGRCNFDWDRIKVDFIAFTKEQLLVMGKFPCADYHFMYQMLPYKMYHGVEHYNSTVIALGPGELISQIPLYEDFLGVSSHELFHTWNVIRIKPREFVPYDFTRENYFETGYVAEGFTTYYGDLFLVRSGVFDKRWYFGELKKMLIHHLQNFGRFNLSLTQSSYDLWVDGYKNGAPDRKVSIYVKGALVAMLLDLKIRQSSAGENSLDTLMQRLWEKFGNVRQGYISSDILALSNELAGSSLNSFFAHLVEGVTPIESFLTALLDYVGCELIPILPDNLFESNFGFKTTGKGSYHVIHRLHPDSPAAQQLSVDDEIIAINGRKVTENLNSLIGDQKQLTLTLFRLNQLQEVTISHHGQSYFMDYEIRQTPDPSPRQRESFEKWLKAKW